MNLREKFDALWIPEPNSGCWIWLGTVAYPRESYPRPCLRVGANNKFASRISFELSVGKIPDGKWILHKCDNSMCVNPAHLYAGTREENVRDAVSRRRLRSGERHPKARLLESDIRLISRLRKRGWKIKTLMEWFEVSRSSIWKIYKGKTWIYVPR